MAWDLWGPPTDFIAEENDCNALSGRKRHVYFGYGYDVIEEDALNDISCVQVLRILINKADSEIDELERDLVSLQSDLAWIENEEWPDLCCNALREKMKFLEISLWTLRNKDKNDVEVHLLLNSQPIDSLHEILKGLLQKSFSKEDYQPGSTDINEVEDKYCFATRVDKRMIQNSSSQDADEEKNATEMVKFQNAEINAVSSTTKTSRHVIGYSKRFKRLSISVVSENVEKHCSMSAADVVIVEDSLSKPAGENTNLGKRTKYANAVIEDFGSSISRQSTVHSSMKIICKDDVEVTGIVDNRERHSRDTRSGILISSSNPQGKGNDQRTDKSADGIIKNVKAAALRCATDLNGRKGKSDSSSSTFDQARSKNVDLDQKICDLAPRHKCMSKGSKSVATTNIICVRSCLKRGAKKSFPHNVNAGESGMVDSTLFTGPHEHEGMNPAELQAKKERKYSTEEIKLAKPAADEESCNWIVPYDPEKAKQNANLPILLEVDLSKVEVHSSSISKGKKRRKPAVSTVNATSNNPCWDLVLPGEIEAEKHDAASDISSWEKLKVAELRVIAKRFHVKQYYKLTKKRLLAELTNRMVIGN